MRKPELSVIIPVYKAEQYIANTINMVLSQSFYDFELILVDDGSPDKSGFICDEAAKQDKRIKVIHKQNEGASIARNVGIDKSSSELITFIDADDEISEFYLESLMADLNRTNNVDFVIQGMIQKWSDKDVTFKAPDGCYDMEEDCERLFDSLKINDFSGPCCKIYKRSILEDNEIRFSSKIIYAEDLDFILRYLLHCQKIVVSSTTNYYYIMHGGTVSSKIYEFDKELSGVTQLLHSYNEVVNKHLCESIIQYRSKSICDYIWRLVFSNYRYNYNRSDRVSNFKKIEADINSFFSTYYKANTVFTSAVKYLFAHRLYFILDILLYLRLSK